MDDYKASPSLTVGSNYPVQGDGGMDTPCGDCPGQKRRGTLEKVLVSTDEDPVIDISDGQPAEFPPHRFLLCRSHSLFSFARRLLRERP